MTNRLKAAVAVGIMAATTLAGTGLALADTRPPRPCLNPRVCNPVPISPPASPLPTVIQGAVRV